MIDFMGLLGCKFNDALVVDDVDTIRSGVSRNIHFIGFNGWPGSAQLQLSFLLDSTNLYRSPFGDSTIPRVACLTVEVPFGVDAQRGTAWEQHEDAADC